MKFLCICYYGHSRSVALTRVLHSRNYHHEAVAVGVGTSPSAIEVLGDWADHIFVLQPQFADSVPERLQHKVFVFDVGPDRWSNPYSQELLDILQAKLDAWLALQASAAAAEPKVTGEGLSA